jgi:hypothetical protein
VKFPAHEKNADIRVSKVFYMKNWSGKKKEKHLPGSARNPAVSSFLFLAPDFLLK